MFGRRTTLGLLTATLVAAGTLGGGTAAWAASDVRGVLVQTATHECLLMAQLARGGPGTPVPNTERTVVTDIARNSAVVDGTAPLQTIATTTVANTVVEVDAVAVHSLGGACAGVGQIIADQHGAGTLNTVRIQ